MFKIVYMKNEKHTSVVCVCVYIYIYKVHYCCMPSTVVAQGKAFVRLSYRLN